MKKYFSIICAAALCLSLAAPAGPVPSLLPEITQWQYIYLLTVETSAIQHYACSNVALSPLQLQQITQIAAAHLPLQ